MKSDNPFSKELTERIAEFDKKHVVKNVVLLGFDEEVMNIPIGFEFDETYTEEE